MSDCSAVLLVHILFSHSYMFIQLSVCLLQILMCSITSTVKGVFTNFGTSVKHQQTVCGEYESYLHLYL